MKILEILNETKDDEYGNDYPVDDNLTVRSSISGAWIRPDGKVYNFGEDDDMLHAGIGDDNLLDVMRDYSYEQHQAAMLGGGWVRVTFNPGSLGIMGYSGPLKKAWTRHIARIHKNFNDIYVDKVGQNGKTLKAGRFEIPHQRRELIQLINNE